MDYSLVGHPSMLIRLAHIPIHLFEAHKDPLVACSAHSLFTHIGTPEVS